MKAPWFKVAKWLGAALTLLSIIFLARRAWLLQGSLATVWPKGAGAGLFSGAVLCAGGGVALVAAWRLLLARHGGGALPFGQAFRVYAGTQIAKYIPGNIFQYAGRHVAGWQAGIPHHALALSAIGEALGLACVAMALVLGGLAATGQIPSAAGFAAAIACLASYPFVQRALRLVGRRWDKPEESLTRPHHWLREDCGALLAHTAFFGATAAAFLLSALPWKGLLAPAPGTLVAACALAWLAGFATPGAPAGLGVRELVLVVALEESLGREGALGAAALFRGATTLGDLLLYAASALVRRPVIAEDGNLPEA